MQLIIRRVPFAFELVGTINVMRWFHGAIQCHYVTEHCSASKSMQWQRDSSSKLPQFYFLSFCVAKFGPIYAYLTKRILTTTIELKFPFIEENSNAEFIHWNNNVGQISHMQMICKQVTQSSARQSSNMKIFVVS